MTLPIFHPPPSVLENPGVGRYLANAMGLNVRMNAARWFQRREDYQPPQTPADSPVRQFDVKCLHCTSYRLRLISEFDEESGGLSLVLFCTRCRNRETLPTR